MTKTVKGGRPRPPAGRRPPPAGRGVRNPARPGRRRAPRPLVRHLAVAAVAAALVGAFWASRPTWAGEMRLWKAVGDAAFVLLLVTLALGPLARIAAPASRLLPWRRQCGIWFALVATVHAVLVVHGWARWSLRRFLGYEVVPELGRELRTGSAARSSRSASASSPSRCSAS